MFKVSEPLNEGHADLANSWETFVIFYEQRLVSANELDQFWNVTFDIFAGEEHIRNELKQNYCVFGGVFNFVFSEDVHHQRKIEIRFDIVSDDTHYIFDCPLNILYFELPDADQGFDNFL